MNENKLFKEVERIYQETYHSDVRMALQSLDGDAATAVYNRYKDKADEGHITEDGITEFSLFGVSCFNDGPWHPSYAAKLMYRDYVGALEKAWFSRISREQAMVFLNAMSMGAGMATFSICYGVDYTNMTFLSAWNKAHPDDESIRINGEMWFSN